MEKPVRNILLALGLLVSTYPTTAGDTLKIHVTFQHKLGQTGHTTGKLVVNQKIHTPEGILFRETNFHDRTGQLTGYVFYFYREGRLYTSEFYNQADSLLYILKHDYDQDGYEIRTTQYGSGKGKLNEAGKTVRVFRSDHRILQQKKYFGKKIGTITRYAYSPSGLLQTETTKTKPASNMKYRLETKSYTHTTEGRLIQTDITGTDITGKTYRYHEEYVYDEHNRPAVTKIYNAHHEQTGTKVYQYLTGNYLSLYEERNAAGIAVVLQEYEYKKHYMEPGTQVSRYEDF